MGVKGSTDVLSGEGSAVSALKGRTDVLIGEALPVRAHEVSRSKHGMSTYAQRSSTGQPSDYDDKSWKHPGESGRASAWLKRSKRDIEMQPDVDGHPPSAIFQQRADMYITIPAIPTPTGMIAPDASTGKAYIRLGPRAHLN
jgi:hypothetical protein